MHSLRTLVTGIVDYAGLFPPAKLDMAPTVRNFATYHGGPDAWMLRRLIVPVARLEEFERAAVELLPSNEDEDVWLVSALTAPAGDDALESDLEAIMAFNERHLEPEQGAVYIDSIELRAPSPGSVDAAMAIMPDELTPYFEIPLEGELRGFLAALAGQDVGAKIRTGGLAPDAVPAPELVAGFLAASAAAEVPFKATAGLHHPLRGEHPEFGGWMHGFLNVFGAACLAWNRKADARLLERLLREERPDGFAFDDEHLEIAGHRVTVPEIEEARERFAHSFGSCSFDEPREGLQSLHLFEKVKSA